MRKFFFDDVRNAPSDKWTLARDVPEAKDILARETFDVWSLDHDIGFQMMCPACEKEISGPVIGDETLKKLREGCIHKQTGTDLARWVVHNASLLELPQAIIIHSANPYGADRMAGLLSPFTTVHVVPYHILRMLDKQWEASQ